MPLEIPIQSVPVQNVNVILNKQNCQIYIRQTNYGLFVDINSDGIDIAIGNIALNITPIILANYSGFLGNLFFLDIEDDNDPFYQELGKRFRLIYVNQEEFEKWDPFKPKS